MKKIIFFMLLPFLNLPRTLYLYKNTQSIYFDKVVRKRLAGRFTVSISDGATVHKDVEFPHPYGIVIGHGAEIGQNCVIYQDVTIGVSNRNDLLEIQAINVKALKGLYPKIGNNVTIYPGAKLIGGIRIGDNSIVGANSVVNKNVNPNETVAGVPAKPIKSSEKS